MQFSQLTLKLKTFLLESKRVLAVTRKPSRLEFVTIVKVTGIGIIIIGLIGFLLQLARNLFL
ncbi:protein translocase SEC61 complex subunit gamma [Candidatus Woesearchaeota archaeon]|nr:protein translocase SEC61 complex subunit gamma [Candidatus Woesearchaeota archaeon]